MNGTEHKYLSRIQCGLEAAALVLKQFTSGQVKAAYKTENDVVTEADRQVSDVLRGLLLRENEGWLSEEDPDDLKRMESSHVWIVDPIDGTREFVDGVPEWCVSIGLVIDGVPKAGGIHNPATNEFFLGSAGLGVTYNGRPARTSQRVTLSGAKVLASRTEFLRGEWKAFAGERFRVCPTGSVAYKLALVAAGLADATWTLSPKHEWDVAAGVALVKAAGGSVYVAGKTTPHFNSRSALLSGLVASGKGIRDEVMQLLKKPSQDQDLQWWKS